MGKLTILLTILLSHAISCSSRNFCPQGQSSALLQFKKTFSINSESSSFDCDEIDGFTSYPKTGSWKNGTDCCSWDGVTCDRFSGYVIGLDLSCSWLTGTFPSNNTLLLLPRLKMLNLAYNDFSDSPLPFELGRLAGLAELNLSNSGFSGELPSEISHLSELSLLDLSLSEVVVDKGGFQSLARNLTKLRTLVLDSTDMSSIKLDSLLMNFSSLRSVSLKENGLEGNLPEDVFRLPYLEELSLSGNENINGHLPNVSWISRLRLLDLAHTNFSGELPDSFANLKSLEYLDISTCRFDGLIPASLGNLDQLIHLDLSTNSFRGHVPDSLGKLNRLTFLHLQENRLRGQFPVSKFNLTQLSSLYFGDNQLSGSLPDYLCGLLNLRELSVLNNHLSGTIPSCLFTLPSLQMVELSNNQISGEIPEFHSPSLQQIDLTNNRFNGHIPRSIMQLKNLTDLFLSSNNLSGTIELDMFSKLDNLETIDLSFNNLSVITKSNYSVWKPKLQRLRLSSCNLSEFPAFLQTQLSDMSILYLSHNKIHGEVPEWLWENGKDSLMYLDLSDNFITSKKKLPLQMMSLNYLDLSSNLLQGQLPVPSTLLYAYLMSNNRFTGTIPSLMCNVSTSISVLDLSNNSLSGTIPECLLNISRRLYVLNLNKNNLQGTIPDTFPKGNMMTSLNLNDNQLEGRVPRSLVDCVYLEVLNLGNNKINDTFPHSLAYLPKLRILVLRANRFHGLIDKAERKFHFPKLRIIDLSYNQFTGALPGGYFEKLTAMMNAFERKMKQQYLGVTYKEFYYQNSVTVTTKAKDTEYLSISSIFVTIDMSSNRFEGEIPPSIGKLISIRVLNLSHNCLSGHIPASLANLAVLESMDLSSNQLNGGIPVQLTDLTFLAVLNLSKNHLTGVIPQARQFGTFPNDSFSGNPGLCGAPLTRKCNNEDVSQQKPFKEDNDESTFELDWKIIIMGYGSGLVIGLSIGYIAFLNGEPHWFARMVERVLYAKQNLRKRNQRNRRKRTPIWLQT